MKKTDKMVEIMEAELDQLRRKLMDLRGRTPNPPLTQPLVRPRDVPELTFSSLQGIEAEARIEQFLSMVEYCTDEDRQRIQVAQMRLEPTTACLVQRERQKGRIKSWKDFKDFIYKTVSLVTNFEQAWQEFKLES